MISGLGYSLIVFTVKVTELIQTLPMTFVVVVIMVVVAVMVMLMVVVVIWW
jgi:hypothetical protein